MLLLVLLLLLLHVAAYMHTPTWLHSHGAVAARWPSNSRQWCCWACLSEATTRVWTSNAARGWLDFSYSVILAAGAAHTLTGKIGCALRF